ncbi:hypothetical protein EMCRGX_G034711 [Ephydatia muelleri]
MAAAAAAAAAASCYFVEILQRLQVAQVSALLDGTEHITVLGNSIFSNGDRSTAFAIDGLGLRLPTYSCLKVTGGDELHVRFKLAEGQNVESHPRKLQLIRPESTTLALRCRFCRSLLTNCAHEFKRVLPLPSDAWQEFYADIFCHMDHSHGSTSSQPPGTICPKEGDCLVGDDKLLVTISSLRQESIVLDSSKEGTIGVMCRRCYSLLGTVLQGGNCHTREAGNTPSMEGGVLPLCLKMSKLLIEEEGEGSAASDLMHPKGSRWKTLEDYFARRIYSVTIATESFRFLLQSDLGSTHIWVLSAGNRVAWSLHHSHQDFSGCYDGPEMESCCSVVSSSRPIMKLLYKATYTPEDEVEILKWDEDDWLNFNWILSNRTKALPPSHRTANGFHVGFLCFL